MRFLAKVVALLPLLAMLPMALLAGDLSRRFDLTFERVRNGGPPRYDEAFLLADVIPEHVRRFTNFSGDLSGRYVGALAVAGSYRAAPTPSLEALVFQILERQKRDGHFGDSLGALEVTADDMARLWGNGRTLIGLLEYHRTHPRPEVLESARRLGDFLVSVGQRFNADSVRRHFSAGQLATGYICWTQNIEGLVALHQATADPRYLALAEAMAGRTSRHPSQHSHGFLSTLRGILDLAEASGKPEYLAQVEREWRELVDSENWLVQGAVPEAFAPGIERDEGCSEADWLRLNLSLWRMTRKPVYLEHAERALFNGFSMNQFPSGDFGHYYLTETGLAAGGVRAWWCCTLHGLRTFPAAMQAVFRGDGTTLYYDLPLDGKGATNGLQFEADSSLEQDGTIRLRVLEADGGPHTLAVRQPAWAGAVHVSLGGEDVPLETRDGYLSIDHIWNANDTLTLEYDLATRIERDKRRAEYAAVFQGPWLLGISEERSPSFFDEPYLQNRVLFPEPDALGQIQLEATPVEADPEQDRELQGFEAPAAHRAVRWIPAGYTSQIQTTTLRPLAERTAMAGVGRWQFWFRVGDAGNSEAAPTDPASDEQRSWIVAVTALAMILIGVALARRGRKAHAGPAERR